MTKAIKEIIIMLLICLVGILLFAVVFYEYIPSRKVVAEVVTYEVSSEIEELLADDIDENGNNVITTYEGNYEVTSSDLSNYEATDTYVPGKSNPFAAVSEEEEEDSENTTSTNSDTNTTSNTSTTNSSSETSTNTSSSYTKDTGTK